MTSCSSTDSWVTSINYTSYQCVNPAYQCKVGSLDSAGGEICGEIKLVY